MKIERAISRLCRIGVTLYDVEFIDGCSNLVDSIRPVGICHISDDPYMTVLVHIRTGRKTVVECFIFLGDEGWHSNYNIGRLSIEDKLEVEQYMGLIAREILYGDV